MTFKRLVEEVCFEAGATGLDNLETVAGIIIEEVLDSQTSLMRYPELFVPDTTLTVADLSAGTITLPADYQHIDWDSLRIQFQGDLENQLRLIPMGHRIKGVNDGKVRYFNRNATTIFVYPTNELDPTDVFKIDYWRKSNAKTNNLITPDQLVQTVKDLAITRLGLAIGSKSATAYIALGQQAHANSMGSTDLPPLN